MSNLRNFIRLNRFHIPQIIKKFNYENYTEIGVQEGKFVEFILNNTTINAINCIDPFLPCNGNECGWGHSYDLIVADEKSQNITKNTFLKVVNKYPDRAKFFHLTSLEYAKKILDNSLDIIFIDGDHSKNGLLLDLKMYFKKLKNGGILVGHDYGGNYGKCEPVTQVKPAVDEFCLENNLKYFVTEKNFCFHNECIESFFICKNNIDF